ncbi:hypothetical protein S83_022458 [Arachis hypogaea]
MILSDRATKKDDKNLLGKIASKHAAKSANKTTKNDALNELRAKRLKQQDSEAHCRLREASRVLGSQHFTPPKCKAFTTASLSSSSHSDSESRSHNNDEGSTGDGGIGSRAAVASSRPHASNRDVISSPKTVTVPPSHPRASNREGQKFAPDRHSASVLPMHEQSQGVRSSPQTGATAACRRRPAIEASPS